MSKSPNLTDLTSQYAAQSTINNNNQKIEDAFQNTLSRDGSTPNQMEADLDMNNNSILNVDTLQVGDISLNGAPLSDSVLQAAQDVINAKNEAELSAIAAEAYAEEAASYSDQSAMEFVLDDYLDPVNLLHVHNHDIGSQDETAVTAAVQQAMREAMDFVMADPLNRSVVVRGKGAFAINDELFPESFADDLWTLDSDARTRWVFDFEKVTFRLKNWTAHAAPRSSGFYSIQGITDPVPKVVFRWEQRSKKGNGPHVIGGKIVGEEGLNDPIGFKGRNINLGLYDGLEIHDLRNVGRWLDDINNSDFRNTILHDVGLQPTQCGGDGFMSSTIRFTTVAGTGQTTVTSNEPIFDAQQVGKWFMVNNAGEFGAVGSAKISSVNSVTEAILDRELEDVTDQIGSFAMIEGDITADSNTLTLTTDCSIDFVGRYVMVWKAGSKLHSEEDLLVTRVTAQNGRVLTLATEARDTVSNAPVCVAPSGFTGKCDDQIQTDGVSPESGHNNDCQFLGERVEFSFDPHWGAAISAVEQFVLATQFYGRKLHGTSMGYTNFGANGMIRWADNCKFVTDFGSQFEWGDWHPDYAKIMVSGARNYIVLNMCNIGGVETMDSTAFFYLDPQAGGTENTRVLVSGFNNTIPNQADNLTMARYGTNGSRAQVGACGPFVSRGKEGYPDMFDLQANSIELWDTAPTLVFRDTNSGIRGRVDVNSGAFRYMVDPDNDGVYENDVFSFLNVNSGNPELHIGGNQVLSTRRTGWDSPNGPASRTAFDTDTVNAQQLAQRVKALIDDLAAHGIIGG